MAGQDDQGKPISLFYSYSHKDEDLRLKLETHLSALRRGGLIAEWHDRRIEAGDDWKEQIDRHLTSADIVLLLVSSDFIASEYCWGEEMTKALARHERGEARVIPVILRHCRWQSTPLARLQAIPKEGKPIRSWPDEDEAFDDVVAAIERSLQEVPRRVEEVRQRAEEEARQRAEEQAKQRAKEEAKQRADEQAKQRAKEEAKQRAEERAKQRAKEVAKQRADEQARQRAEEEARQRAEERAKQRAKEVAKQRADEQARQRADEQAKQRAKEEAKQQADEQAGRWDTGYLRDYEHDIFVSYAHSPLDDWSTRLIEDVRKFVAGGLGLRQTKDVDLWMDYEISGNAPLTRQLRDKVKNSGVLLVLMSDWYLKSAWCRDERDWFVTAVRQRGADRVFVVRVCATDDRGWPETFKDEHGHPLVGYNFTTDADLSLPKGYPRPEDALDSREYYDALGKLARDMVSQLTALKRAEIAVPGEPRSPPRLKQSVFLAAVPEEDDVEELRDELAGLLVARGCEVVPETNPLASDEVHQWAPEWVAKCNRFAQVLGTRYGRWKYDDIGLVMYQHALATQHQRPIFVYRAPAVDLPAIKYPEYRTFLEGFDQQDIGSLQSFADRVVGRVLFSDRSVFMMASACDENLARKIRRILTEFDVSVFPVGSVARVLADGSSLLDILRRCDAILLVNGEVKEEDPFWVDSRVVDIKLKTQRQLGCHLALAIIDAPPEPRLESWGDVCVFAADSPTLEHDLQDWLRALGGRTGPTAGHAA